jgi:hypothetical protein
VPRLSPPQKKPKPNVMLMNLLRNSTSSRRKTQIARRLNKTKMTPRKRNVVIVKLPKMLKQRTRLKRTLLPQRTRLKRMLLPQRTRLKRMLPMLRQRLKRMLPMLRQKLKRMLPILKSQKQKRTLMLRKQRPIKKLSIRMLKQRLIRMLLMPLRRQRPIRMLLMLRQRPIGMLPIEILSLLQNLKPPNPRYWQSPLPLKLKNLS